MAESYVNVLGRVKGGIEKASQLLTEILKMDSEFIPAMLCLAVIRFIQKKQTEAKNLLKILWKKPYSSEYGEDLERAWLLYANSFIQVSHFSIFLFEKLSSKFILLRWGFYIISQQFSSRFTSLTDF